VAGLVIAANAGTDGLLRYPLLVVLALALALVFLCISAGVALVCRRKPVAFGLALFVWFFFVLFYDLLVIGVTFLLPERTANMFLFASLFGNPVDLVRVSSLIVLNGEGTFGPAGAALVRFLGGNSASIALLVVALLFWAVAPLWVARRLLDRQDI